MFSFDKLSFSSPNDFFLFFSVPVIGWFPTNREEAAAERSWKVASCYKTAISPLDLMSYSSPGSQVSIILKMISIFEVDLKISTLSRVSWGLSAGCSVKILNTHQTRSSGRVVQNNKAIKTKYCCKLEFNFIDIKTNFDSVRAENQNVMQVLKIIQDFILSMHYRKIRLTNWFKY